MHEQLTPHSRPDDRRSAPAGTAEGGEGRPRVRRSPGGGGIDPEWTAFLAWRSASRLLRQGEEDSGLSAGFGGREVIGCGCPPGEYAAEALVLAGGAYFDVIGAGATPGEAAADACEHGLACFGGDAVVSRIRAI